MTDDVDVARGIRLIARSDVGPASGATVGVACTLELELADGRRVPLLTDRGWGSSATWDRLSEAELADTARVVTGPDEPAEGRTREQEEDAYWVALARAATAAGATVEPAALRAAPVVGETTPRLAALLATERRRGAALTALLGTHPEALGTVAPEDVLGPAALTTLRAELAGGLGISPTAWSTPGVVLAPADDADPDALRVLLLHTAAVVAGLPALLAGLAGTTVAELLDEAALGERLGRPVAVVSDDWVYAADMNALSFDPAADSEQAARQRGLCSAVQERGVAVERVPVGDRSGSRAAVDVGLRRVGRERVLRVRA